MTINPVSLAITAGLTALQVGMQAMKRIEGPRLTELQVTSADYGTPLNDFVGRRRFEGAPIFWAIPLREVKQTRKTKGGKYNEYTYFGTFAAIVADREIGAVTRIWLDKHLAYDVTGSGPVTPFPLSGGKSITDYIRIYLGTETQEPDPTMLAEVEARNGAGSCPAYRGVSYVMFDGLPLEKFGNRIPQITFEAVTAAAPHYPYESFEPKPSFDGFTYSPDFSRFLIIAYPNYEIWDVAARAQMIAGPLPATMSGGSGYGISSTGSIYTMGSDHVSIRVFSPDGVSLEGTITGMAVGQSRIVVRRDGRGLEHLLTQHDFYPTYYTMTLGGVSGLIEGNTADETGATFNPKFYFTDSHGDIWMTGANPTQLFLYRIVDTGARPGSSGYAVITMPDPGVGQVQAFAAHHDGRFIVAWHFSTLYAIDEDTMTVVDSAAVSTPIDGGYNAWANLQPGASSIWLDFTEVSLADLSVIQTVDPLDWKTEDVYVSAFDPINDALICWPQFADVITWRYLNRVGAAAVILGDVVDAVASRCRLDPGDYDASALTQEIDGYSWTQGPGNAILEPLLASYDSIVRPHNFALEFRPLGDTPTATIETEWFVRQGEEPRYKVTIVQDTDLPLSVSFSFADLAKDQQTNTIVSQRRGDAVDTARELTLDMTTLAIGADAARSLADRYFRRSWAARTGVENALTRRELVLEPGDVRTLGLDGVYAGYLLSRLEIGANGVLGCRWRWDHPSLAALSGSPGAQMDGRLPSVILVPLPSKAFVLDLPLLRDSDDAVTPGLYHGAAPYASGAWPGETLFQSLDGGLEYSTEKASIPASAPSSWGVTTDALGDANPRLWDRGNSVNVRMQYGTLTSTTEALINASPTLNLAVLFRYDDGELRAELFQFATATLEGDGSYTLTGHKRGRRGTEWAVSGHTAGETFLLLDSTALVTMGVSDVGTDLYFKGVTDGRDASSAFPVNVAFTGASLKPYAPAQLRAVKDPATGDWDFDWVRRSRIGGAWTSGTTVPLGEATEAYEIDILDGMGAVVRTISVTSPAATYTAAEQATDGGDVPVGSLDVALYQISALVDRGFAATASF